MSAFVGPSGSGKSTIFNLIERMYDIERGDIKYGNQRILRYSTFKVAHKIGYVMHPIR